METITLYVIVLIMVIVTVVIIVMIVIVCVTSPWTSQVLAAKRHRRILHGGLSKSWPCFLKIRGCTTMGFRVWVQQGTTIWTAQHTSDEQSSAKEALLETKLPKTGGPQHGPQTSRIFTMGTPKRGLPTYHPPEVVLARAQAA